MKKPDHPVSGHTWGKLPANKTPSKDRVVDRNPYSKPSPRMKMGGRAQRSRGR